MRRTPPSDLGVTRSLQGLPNTKISGDGPIVNVPVARCKADDRIRRVLLRECYSNVFVSRAGTRHEGSQKKNDRGPERAEPSPAHPRCGPENTKSSCEGRHRECAYLLVHLVVRRCGLQEKFTSSYRTPSCVSSTRKSSASGIT
jgi:hypothetical protein